MGTLENQGPGVFWADRNEGLLGEINDRIWGFSEPGLEERRSSACLAGILEEKGFSVKRGVGGMETAFQASFGTEGPVIGFLAEYDALPGLSQKAGAVKEKNPDSPDWGHGCGHNSLAAAITGGALAVREAIAAGKVKGRILVFGCPAEELLIGKVKMAGEGLFSACDILLSCHPNDVSYVWARSSSAVWSGDFVFTGRTAHAAIDPENGRSALDGVELMNVGANYLREHVAPDVRFHYVTPEGGVAPNVVPERARVWYTVRAKDGSSLKDTVERLKNVARGAALMTGTVCRVRFRSGCAGVLRNPCLEQVFLEALKQAGAPQWEEEDYRLAEKLSEQLPAGLMEQAAREYGLGRDGVERGLAESVCTSLYREGETMAVSTDVGDASWQAPTGVFSFASTVVGAPGHSWFYTACCGSPMARRGVQAAVRVFEAAVLRLLQEPELIEEARRSFDQERAGGSYVNALEVNSSEEELL